MHYRISLLAAAAAAFGTLLAIGVGTAAHADTVTIDTSALQGQSGYFEFFYAGNPANGPAAPTSVDLSDIITGSTGFNPITLSNASLLTGTSKDTLVDDFGSTFKFNYNLSTSSLPVGDSGDDLDLYFFGSGPKEIVSTAPGVSSDLGTVAWVNFASGATPGAPVVATLTTYKPSFVPTPEVNSGLLMLLGLVAAGAVWGGRKGAVRKVQQSYASR